MARQTYYLDREQKHPLYRTRMLQAGPIELDASAARLYRRLGVELLDQKPKRSTVEDAQAEHNRRQTAARVAPHQKATTKAAPRKAATKRTRKAKK